MQPFKTEVEIKAMIADYVEVARREAIAHGWNQETYIFAYLSGLMAGHVLACKEASECVELVIGELKNAKSE